jgi:hypothetical protein
VSLKRAREKRDEARRLLADGVDPSVQRKVEQSAQTETFEAIVREWMAHRAKTTAAITQQKAQWTEVRAGVPLRYCHAPQSRSCASCRPSPAPGEYVFPSLLSLTRPMSNNTVNTALRRLGYTREQMTGHGFRSMASTLLNAHGFRPDVIELQLAHAERNKVRAAYDKAQRLAERRTRCKHGND